MKRHVCAKPDSTRLKEYARDVANGRTGSTVPKDVSQSAQLGSHVTQSVVNASAEPTLKALGIVSSALELFTSSPV
ncbi:hypothetical protein BaRGS_00016593 [Batillaria attramentaria]|uniref:Uncharacterized protein n=1 Tax=Batillaria attramentaria TaxID=370345 RepID=A0ABD0KY26_9CAEN